MMKKLFSLVLCLCMALSLTGAVAEEWDAAYDVVVIGFGGAGASAAIEAADAGAKVLVLEKMPMVGGNSLKASGGMNCADTKFQAAAGITDSGVPEFIEDTMNGGHQLNDLALVTTMAENSAE